MYSGIQMTIANIFGVCRKQFKRMSAVWMQVILTCKSNLPLQDLVKNMYFIFVFLSFQNFTIYF